MVSLKDVMDRKLRFYLGELGMYNLCPALASTCVARNIEFWLTQLQANIAGGTQDFQIPSHYF